MYGFKLSILKIFIHKAFSVFKQNLLFFFFHYQTIKSLIPVLRPHVQLLEVVLMTIFRGTQSWTVIREILAAV